MTNINLNIFLRALAIAAVVFNHAYIDRYLLNNNNFNDIFFGFGLGGGAVILLILSGYNFAEYILSKSEPQAMRQSIFKLAKSIVIPCFLLIVFYFLLLNKFDIQELLFYKNWLSDARIAKFPTWYPQTILQILIVFYLILPLFNQTIKKYALTFSFIALLVSISICLISLALMETFSLKWQTPLFFLWYFVMGWVIFYAVAEKSNTYRLLSSVILTLSAILCMNTERSEFYCVLIAGLSLIWFSEISIPTLFKQAILLISQATFTIFLFHRFFFEVSQKFLPSNHHFLVLFSLSMIACVLLWASYTAFSRTFKKHFAESIFVR